MGKHATMNRVFRLIWNELTGTWIAVAEHARGRGKRGRAMRLAPILFGLGLCLPAQAAPPLAQLPTGAQVAAGSIAVTPGAGVDAARLDVNQASARGVIDWQRFDVGAQAHVHFSQPSSSAVTLNRVLDSQPSQIFGRISADGQVFLSNPNGVYFGPSASVDVGGLVATTHAISNTDFMAGGSTFSRDGATGRVVNDGRLNANSLGGYVALLAPQVRNSGVIVAQAGTVALAAGDMIELQFDGKNTLVGLRVTPSTIDALVENRLAVQAPGGRIILSAQAASQLQGGVVQHSGSLSASSMVSEGGVIRLVGDQVQLDAGSSVAAAGAARGGEISVEARRVLQSGSLDASGVVDGAGRGGHGGTISVRASDQILQTTLGSTTADGAKGRDGGADGDGGRITLQAGHTLYSSGTVSAQGRLGGTVHALGEHVVLAAARLEASGSHGGGTVLVGGDFQGGNPLVVNARTVDVSPHTQIRADARDSGDGGKAIVWADGQATFRGSISARGGAQAGHGGQIEVSAKEELVYGGAADASAPRGTAGSLLLDPANLVISDAGSLPAYSFVDPNATAGGKFGAHIVPLSSGNVVVTASEDTIGGIAKAGAVYLYDGLTGGLISALTGSTADDLVGAGGITVLSNGNYVVRSTGWGNGPTAKAGAVTWGSGSTGVSGAVSGANSLVGSKADDAVGGIVTALTHGNYVVSSSSWDDGGIVDAGAVTWGSGSTGISGAVSSANSLVGSTAGDAVGNRGVTALSNGNYVVSSWLWDNGAIVNAGAVTWGDGAIGIRGVVSGANSLVGSTASDQVGFRGVTALANGNYVVVSDVWDNGAAASAGAVTWGDGSIGISGPVTSTNSLVGSRTQDFVGGNGVTALANGNYVVRSDTWRGGSFVTQAGAVTWGSGTSGVSGVVSAANSLVGSTAGDNVGSGGVTALANGNYVVNNYKWDNGGITDAGAVTWGDGAIGIRGFVSDFNSLVGSTASDQVGFNGVTALANGNYVVVSAGWDNGAAVNAGAVTWGDGSSGISGVVSSTNSLVGSKSGDAVGGNGVTALTNGNYVVSSRNWDDGGIDDVGAITWGSGSSGITGTVSAVNSLVGSTSKDWVGLGGVFALANGNYVVTSYAWDNGIFWNAGAVTWGDGSSGTRGAVSSTNSLMGGSAGDLVGSGGVTSLSNGNYVVVSDNWTHGTVGGAGAVTWGNSNGGVNGLVSASNSLVGSSAGDRLGSGGVAALTDGSYVAKNPDWRNGANDNAGAVTWGSGTAGVTGTVSPSNSLLGTVADQRLGSALAQDGVNGTFLAGDALGLTVQAGFVDPNQITYARAGGSTLTITPRLITDTLDTGTAVTLQASNDITINSPITASGDGALTMQAGGSLAVNAPISIGGVLTLEATGIASDITLNAVIASAAANDSVVLAAGRHFINNAGAGAIDPGAGRYLVYASDPAAGSRGDLGHAFKQYGTAYGDALLGSGSGFIYILAPTITAGLVGSVGKTYDGSLSATLAGNHYTISGAVDGDTVSLNHPAAGSYDSKDVGSGKVVSVSGLSVGGASNGAVTVYGYRMASATASGAIGLITPRALAVTASGIDRVYDGSAAATVTFADDRIAGDLLTLSGTAAFADKHAGSAKPITVTGIGVAGADAGNYSVSPTTTTTGNITPRALSFSATGTDRVYDGTTAATVTFADDRIAGDDLSLSSTAAFADKHAGSAKPIAISGIGVAGADAGNYSLGPTTVATTADITPRALSFSATGIDRVYDGTTAAAVTFADDRIAGDELSLSGIAAFADKHVGLAKPIAISGIGAASADARNYSLALTSAAATADVTPRALSLTVSGIDRVYDGTTAAAVTFADDRIAGDELSLSGTAAFADKHVGLAKPIAVTGIGLAGADAANYHLGPTSAVAIADITPRTLNLTATGVDRVYDGTTAASVSFADDRIAGDELSLSSMAAQFADAEAGTSKSIAVTGVGIAGADAHNYALAHTTAATTARIMAASVSIGTDAGASLAQMPLRHDPPAERPGDVVLVALSQAPVQTADESAGTDDETATEDAAAPVTAVRKQATSAAVADEPARRPVPQRVGGDRAGAGDFTDRRTAPGEPWRHVDRLATLRLQDLVGAPGRAWIEAAIAPLASALTVLTDDAARTMQARSEWVLRASLTNVWRELDTLKQSGDIRHAQRQRLIFSVGGGVFLFSAGYILWLLFGGALASLTFAVMPLWNGFDPLPVLARKRGRKAQADEHRPDADALAAEERVRALLRPARTNPSPADTSSP